MSSDITNALKQAREALQNVLTYTRTCDFLPGAAEAVRAIDAALATSSAPEAKPQKPLEIRLTSTGALDEIVGSGTFHLEQMNNNHWWIQFEDANGEYADVNLTARGTIRVNFEHSCLASDGSIPAAGQDERAVEAPVAVFEGYVDGMPIIRWESGKLPVGTEFYVRAVEADKTKERQRIELGVIEFHPKDGLREEFYRVIDDLTEAGSAVDVWLMDIATVLKEHGYSMEIYKDKT